MQRVVPTNFTIQTARCLLRRPSADDIPHAFQKKGHWIEANKMSITKREWLLLGCRDR